MQQPPPAYHTVVGPNDPLPNMLSPYDDLDDSEKEEEEEEDDTPEINIDATTLVKGHGNVISIAQMDTTRMASIIATILHGEEAQHLDASHRAARQNGTLRRDMRRRPKVHITINCGATVVGDRNVVGTGLGEVARQVQATKQQLANQQRLVALQQQQQQQRQQQQRQHVQACRTHGFHVSNPKHPAAALASGLPSPVSRRGSIAEQGLAGDKRKAGDAGEDALPKRPRS